MIFRPILTFAIAAGALLAGCDHGGPSAKIPDAELRTKWRDCKLQQNPSRIMVLACENYERECQRRLKRGNKVCY